MRLDKRRTVLVGFAFLSICAFWQMYNNVVPLILTNTFHMNETWSGAIMAADNVAGLFLLPLFGGLSDRCRSPMGRRKPFLICGTAAAVVLMLVLPGLDNSYAAAPAVWKTAAFVAVLGGLLVAMGSYRSPAVALMPDVTPKPLRSEANAVINLMGAMGGVLYLLLAAVLYSKEQPGHTDYYPLFAAVAAIMVLSAVVVSLTVREPSREEVLGGLLVAMGSYRSPAVALMPDVTPKPLRSEANAVINLMGAMGGVLYLLLAAVLYSKEQPGHTDYYPLFAAVAAIMVLSAVVVSLTVREPSREEVLRRDAEEAVREQRPAGNAAQTEAMPAPVRRSLGFLLLSIALWFIGYNAVETWFTTYASQVWGMALGESSVCLTIAMAGAIASYVPVGALAGRIGRKNTILLGTALLTASFFCAFLSTLAFAQFSPVMYVLFVMVGIAWAAISVNSLPMVVEMCRAGDVGRFTGYYYTFSMAAQTITPIAAGWLLRHVGYDTLFPYAAIFSACSMLTMFFVRHGDSRLTPKGEEARV